MGEWGGLPWSLQDWRLDVVFVPQLWGSGHLLGRDGTGSVHLQPCNTERSSLSGGGLWRWRRLRPHLPMERILAWLGAWAFGLPFFFSSSPFLSFTLGTLLSSFLLFFSKHTDRLLLSTRTAAVWWLLMRARKQAAGTSRRAVGHALGADDRHPAVNKLRRQSPQI